MCGIVGYIGNRQALGVLIDGLGRLEYRGYDSSGVAVSNGEEIKLAKAKGRIQDLKTKIGDTPILGDLGIGHTRWATHGEPSDVNAHPHTDCNGDVFVVHNGIIENYRTLKEELIRENHKFVSDTDTEILAHLVEREIASGKSLVDAVRVTLRVVEGAYGLVVISKQHPGLMIAARLGSPLVIGRGDEENVVASDVTAVLPITRTVIYLDDYEIAEVTSKTCLISGLNSGVKNKAETLVDWTLEEASKGGFEHFMLKEIHEQPEALLNSIRGRLDFENVTPKLGGLEMVKDKLREVTNITLLGMGTARHAAMVGEYMIEEYAGVNTEVDFGSEYTYKQSVSIGKHAVLAVSQSGETADTLFAVKEAKRKGLLTLGIVNVTASSIARETDAGVYNHIGPEMAVASTKAFVSQATIFAMLAVFLGRQRNLSMVNAKKIMEEIKSLPSMAKKIISNQEAVKRAAEKFKHASHMFYLGRKYNYPVALEGALKLKEIAYVHAEGYNAAEMKHGPIALLDEGFPVVVIAPKDSVYEKNVSHIREVALRGAEVIVVTTEGNTSMEELTKNVFYIPKTLEMLTPVLSVIPLQLFSYYMAVARGTDVDKPRNLAKSVTVE